MDRVERFNRLVICVAPMMFLFLISHASSAEATSPVLPISSITPGVVNPQVTQVNIQTTICVSGYTATIRPPSSYATTLKKKQLETTYSFYHDSKLGDFEEDHLISLEIGGHPTDKRNLWPQHWSGRNGAHKKDILENRLHRMVCNGKISLEEAQTAVFVDWISAYKRYVVGRR